MKIENGLYVVGVVQGFVSEPWRNDKTKFNHRLVIRRDYQDRYGNPAQDYENIDVMNDDVQRIQAFAAENKDKRVMCPVNKQARQGGKNGAWMSTYLPSGLPIQVIQ